MDIKQRLLAKRELEQYDIPGCGVCYFRHASNAERVQLYEQWLFAATTGKVREDRAELARARTVMLTLCDENGTLVFGEDDLQDIHNMPASLLVPLAEIAAKCLGLADNDIPTKVKKKSDD
jgi:hypothetical protein